MVIPGDDRMKSWQFENRTLASRLGQGYLRARWMPRDGDGWADPSRLVAEVARLGTEAPVALPPEHVH